MYRSYMPRSFDYRSLETAATSGYLSPKQMENHSVARVRCSLIAGVDLALMKSNSMIRPGTLLSAAGAAVQDDKGNRANHAAHALRCGILANGKPLHQVPEFRSVQTFVAEPYRFTNILPASANQADRRAESVRQSTGKGLAKNFEGFCQSVLFTGSAARGKLDKGSLLAAFNNLIRDYRESFELALSITEDISSGRITRTPGSGTEIDLSVKLTTADYREDDIRTALRTQLITFRDLGPSAFSQVLVEQVESDFYAVLKENKR